MTGGILLREFFVNVVLGSVSGGVTSAVAVWMLFRPYEPRFGLQGAIPKNKAKLAKSIGRTVGEKLLTPDDVIAELERSGVRAAVEERLAGLITATLEQDFGSLREALPPAVFVELERVIVALGGSLAEGYVRHVHTDEFADLAREFVVMARAQLAQVALADVLSEERRTALAQRAASLSTELIQASRQSGARTTGARIRDLLLRLAGPDRTERLVERTVADALGGADNRTLGDVIETIPDEQFVSWIVAAARSPRAAEFAFSTAGGTARSLLERPIGRPTEWLPEDLPHRMAHAAAGALWDWCVRELPAFLERLEIESIVERKVMGFSTERIEEIIRGVTQRQLTLIIELGYVLGGVIGLVTFLIEWAVG